MMTALQALQAQLGSQVSLVGECGALSPLFQVRLYPPRKAECCLAGPGLGLCRWPVVQ